MEKIKSLKNEIAVNESVIKGLEIKKKKILRDIWDCYDTINKLEIDKGRINEKKRLY